MPAGSVRHEKIISYWLIHWVDKPYLNEIHCHTKEQGLVGTLRFYPRGKVPRSVLKNPPLFDLNFDIERYQEIIETLRYEKPIKVYVEWDANNTVTNGYLATPEAEPIGEQEGV